ncbi:hypothetical protein [Sodalis praecaptivus]|uniref:hypothetical protein n=1 Tax=Sodalis praecaptivus TaxID=1239307 RepID=UPI0027FBBD88|nr:hypothetical protein [Sodalis praecaptivus]CAJ0996340.1 hypothetical protein NVIRENTERO_02348 [Sodalis praecaptivus]
MKFKVWLIFIVGFLAGYSGWVSAFIITPTDSRIDAVVPFSFSAEKEFQFYLFTAGGDTLPIVPIPGVSFSAQCDTTPAMGNIAYAWNLGTKSPEQIGSVTRVNGCRFTLVNNSGQPIELNNYILAMFAEGSEPTYMEYVYITGTFPAKQACTISVPSEVNLGSIPASDLHPGRPANDFRKTFTVNSNCGGGTAKIALTTPIIANGCPATSAGMLFCLDNDGNKIDMSVSGGDI